MASGGRRDASGEPLPGGSGRTPDGGLLRDRSGDPLHGTWVADEVQQALRRVDALTREIEHVETVVRSQADEVSRIHDSLQIVEGRTARHEAGQEQAREVRQEIVALEERLAQEAALRRDLQGQVDRFRSRDSEHQQELFRALQAIAERLDEIDGRADAERLRQRTMRDEIAEGEQGGTDVEARLQALERRVAAEFEGSRHLGSEVARLAASVTGLMSAIDAAEVRARAITEDHHRLTEAIANLGEVRDHEGALRELVEQQRATRTRLEERLAQAEELIADLTRQVEGASDVRSLLQRQIAGEAEQRRALAERVEAQRDTFIEHLRRQARAQEESHRRLIEDMERDIRIARQLLVRLSEDTDETDQEQPL